MKKFLKYLMNTARQRQRKEDAQVTQAKTMMAADTVALKTKNNCQEDGRPEARVFC